jgi:hypothetical protein
MQRSFFVQVRAKRSSITRGELQLPPFWNWHGVQPVEIATQNFFQLAVIQLKRAEANQNRAIRGVEIAHAGNRFPFQQAQQFPNALVSLKRDPLAKVNQKRLIARALELRSVSL